MSVAEFSARTRIVAGRGCVAERLDAEVAGLGAVPVAVVADQGLADAGLLEPLLAHVTSVPAHVCALVGPDPDIDAAEAAAAVAIEHGARAVLIIGGGSALCAGKAVAIRLRNPAPLDAYMGVGNLQQPPAPTVAVPTTAGSGSEVSTVTVLHDPRHAQHVIIRGEGYEPEVALLDGELLSTLPARPMIAAALDALSHALEALWAVRASRYTDVFAVAAASAIREALPRALDGDVDAMQLLLEMSAMANLACGNSGLALVHALTSSPGVHLPHGYQNGVLLPHVAEFNASALRPAAASEVTELGAFYERIGFRAAFAEGEVTAQGSASMVAAALANPLRNNNVRVADADELRGILSASGAAV
jgi:alcohol dehydrogenase class IV